MALPVPVLAGWSLAPVPPPPTRRRRGLLVSGIAVALLLIVAMLVMFWPDPATTGTDEPGGEAIIGAGPSADQSVGRVPGPSSTAGRGAASALPGGTATVTVPGTVTTATAVTTVPGAADASLTVEARSGMGTIEITIRNVGGGPTLWHSVTLRLTGVNLGVSSADPDITVTPVPGGYCAVPTAGSAPLAASATTDFTLNVLGLLSGVQSVGIDEAPCPA